ncbi:hypothetical protein NEOLEDRAFT_482787 [Neolentinus lepideus HHB14362 ss-1]|uniref:Uncharacterized protein n=1 Tax=Neolentinus lepideus HHB14362 ss-1 TaxID=1314782 RepID=A0A165VLY4_9AGAM|nr:hypothetical protein NEOLEDRAFT_482787 [Neolentinus lepideus HHB14362 ss-1]
MELQSVLQYSVSGHPRWVHGPIPLREAQSRSLCFYNVSRHQHVEVGLSQPFMGAMFPWTSIACACRKHCVCGRDAERERLKQLFSYPNLSRIRCRHAADDTELYSYPVPPCNQRIVGSISRSADSILALRPYLIFQLSNVLSVSTFGP